MEIFKRLSQVSGPSGREEQIREEIYQLLKDRNYTFWTDRLGSLHVKNPGKPCGKKIILDAHMDELGFMITGYRKDGGLEFETIGGYYEFLLPGKAVSIGQAALPGVICGIVGKDRSDLYIRTGCRSSKEAMELFQIGEVAVLRSFYQEFGEDQFQARNIDDRVGCAVLVEILLKQLDVEFTAVFDVREEVGLLGAYVSAYEEQPDVAICLEGGSSADIPPLPEDEYAIVVGNGPAVTIRNEYTIFEPKMLHFTDGVAKKYQIPIQYRRGNVGGCDSHAMQQVGKGADVITVSVASRYIHSRAGVGSRSDYKQTIKLVEKMILEISERGNIIK